MQYAKVHYKVVALTGDGDGDPDLLPDQYGVSGTCTFTPSVARYRDPDTAAAVLLVPVKAQILHGALTFRDNPFIWLPAAPRDAEDVPDFTWTYKADYRYGVSWRLSEKFVFDLRPTGETGFDLSTVDG